MPSRLFVGCNEEVCMQISEVFRNRDLVGDNFLRRKIETWSKSFHSIRKDNQEVGQALQAGLCRDSQNLDLIPKRTFHWWDQHFDSTLALQRTTQCRSIWSGKDQERLHPTNRQDCLQTLYTTQLLHLWNCFGLTPSVS